MKLTLLIGAVLCASALALPPKHRFPRASEICDSHTPCGWSLYKEATKIIYDNVDNKYCVCGEGMRCSLDDEDTLTGAYVHRCKPDIETTTDTDTDMIP